MRLDVSSLDAKTDQHTNVSQDPTVQKATGKNSPIDVMAALREMKNKS
jgi:hypothetical protein